MISVLYRWRRSEVLEGKGHTHVVVGSSTDGGWGKMVSSEPLKETVGRSKITDGTF